jgi:hypothetical protein
VKRIVLAMVFLISLAGCAYIGTVKPELTDKVFQSQNLPYRALSVAVISEDSWPRVSIESTIRAASDLLAEQVGIRLRIDKWIDHRIPSFGPVQGLQHVVETIGEEHRKYDLVIGFSARGVPSHLLEMVTWIAWLGAIDDNYRKFVIIKYLDERVLIHEICHAFVFDRKHSMNGVLSAAVIKIPLVPALFNLPRYLSVEDRKEVLQNKWRSFNEKPAIPEKYQADTVVVPSD